MSELEYLICRVIKDFNRIGIAPNINQIAKAIQYSNPGTRYHLNKLVKKGILKKEDRKYYLLVKNVR